ncbi:hypothetical protein ACFFWC_03510 [Plantactinospora siamensis]|uniref:Glycosyltransferase RgtA/B/C/D-like domain-containing protein n=1 Tax=Plantactinospora siamensis TaxID=555372 RepID=A0ABV6NQP5_9ACTN
MSTDQSSEAETSPRPAGRSRDAEPSPGPGAGSPDILAGQDPPTPAPAPAPNPDGSADPARAPHGGSGDPAPAPHGGSGDPAPTPGGSAERASNVTTAAGPASTVGDSPDPVTAAGEPAPKGAASTAGGVPTIDGDPDDRAVPEKTPAGTADPVDPSSAAEPPSPSSAAEPASPSGAADPSSAAEPADSAEPGGDTGSGDPWAAFGPAGEARPSRAGRVAHAVYRFLVHEWTLAALASLVLAVVMTWPTLRYPLHTIPQDIWDPTLQAWQMAWSGHALLHDPGQLWQSNTFYPEPWSFAFSDTLLGYAPAGMLGTGPVAALLRYNILFVLVHALATFGGYALARQLGAGRIGAAVAGASYTYAPWLLAQDGHLHVLSNGGIPLAFAMLARGHGWSLRRGYRPERRNAGWAVAGWLVASWQITLGFGIGLPFAYVLGLVVLVSVVVWYVRRFTGAGRRPFGWRLLGADLGGGLVFAATGALMSIPFFKVAELYPYAKRSLPEVDLFSPPADGFLIAPAESRIWGAAHEQARAALPWHPEMTLLPGFMLYGLALVGLVFSIWTVRQRLFLAAGTVLALLLAMGTKFHGGRYTYVPLFEHLPGWDGLRTPGRLMLWTTLLLGLLAAGAVTALCVRVRELAAHRVPPWPGPWLRLVTLVPLALVLIEGLNVTPHPVVPEQPDALRTLDGPLLVLPSDQSTDQNVMLWTTSRFQPVVNGGSGFTPQAQQATRDVTKSFPDPNSVEYLRGIGVHTVVLLRDRVAGTPWQTTIDLPVDSLGIQRQDVGNVVVYRF